MSATRACVHRRHPAAQRCARRRRAAGGGRRRGAGHLRRATCPRTATSSRRHRARAAAAHVLLRPGEHERHAERGVGAGRLGGRAQPVVGRRLPGGGQSSTRRRSSTGRTARAAPGCSRPTRTRSMCSARPSARSASPARRSPAYRQLINRPFINPQDNRMVPEHVRGLHADGRGGTCRTSAATSPRRRCATPRASAGCRTSPAAPATSRASPSPAARGTSARAATSASTSSTRSTCSTRSTPTSGIRSPLDDKTTVDAGRAVLSADLGRRRADRVVLDLGLRAAGGRHARTGRRAALLDADRQGARHAQSRSGRTRRTST